MAFDDIEKPGEGLPWMVRVDAKRWITLEMDMDEFEEVHNAGPKQKWNAYMVGMRNVADNKGREMVEDGIYEVPFWAMKALWEYLTGLAKRKGWVMMEYRRIERGGVNEAEFQ